MNRELADDLVKNAIQIHVIPHTALNFTTSNLIHWCSVERPDHKHNLTIQNAMYRFEDKQPLAPKYTIERIGKSPVFGRNGKRPTVLYRCRDNDSR